MIRSLALTVWFQPHEHEPGVRRCSAETEAHDGECREDVRIFRDDLFGLFGNVRRVFERSSSRRLHLDEEIPGILFGYERLRDDSQHPPRQTQGADECDDHRPAPRDAAPQTTHVRLRAAGNDPFEEREETSLVMALAFQ